VSQENVDLVQALIAAFVNEGDAVALVRDEERMGRLAMARQPFFHDDFETIVRGWPAGDRTYRGVLGQRSFWQDWLAPWIEFRQELWRTVDLGDRVLVFFHDFGRHKDSTEEIRGESAGVWTVRDGRVARAEFFLRPSDALKAVGLEG
jgi:ketosteroid isomerase-like protein